MKSTGIVRKIDELGRITLPKEMRDTHDLPEGTPLEVFIDGDKIVLRRYATGCILCGEALEEGQFLHHQKNNRSICYSCIEEARLARDVMRTKASK